MNVLAGAYVLMLMTFVAGVMFRPAVSVTAVLCLFVLKQMGQVSSPWLLQHATFSNYAIGSIVAIAVVRAASRGPLRLGLGGWGGLLTVSLFAYALLSAIWSPAQDRVWGLWGQAGPYIITCILLAPLTVRSLQDVQTVIRSVVAIGGTLAVLLLVFGTWSERGLALGGADTTWTNPLELAFIGGFSTIAAIVMGGNRLQLAGAAFRYSVVIAGTLLIIKSGSRGQLIALAIAALTTIPIRYRVAKPRNLAAAVLAAGVLIIAVDYGLSEFAAGDARWTSESTIEATRGRLDASFALLAAWASTPFSIIFGVGNSGAFDPRIIGFYPHVMPLEVLGEEGLVGFAALTAVLCFAVRACFELIHSEVRSEVIQQQKREVGAFLVASIVFAFVASLKQGNLLSSDYFFMSAMILFRMSALVREEHLAHAPGWPTVGAKSFENLLR
jgi:hypothetical protein